MDDRILQIKLTLLWKWKIWRLYFISKCTKIWDIYVPTDTSLGFISLVRSRHYSVLLNPLEVCAFIFSPIKSIIRSLDLWFTYYIIWSSLACYTYFYNNEFFFYKRIWSNVLLALIYENYFLIWSNFWSFP